LAAAAFRQEPSRNEDSLGRSLFLAGAIILLLGIAGIAVPYFTTRQTKDVADLGPLHVQATQQQSHVIPPLIRIKRADQAGCIGAQQPGARSAAGRGFERHG
jgi:hypothetical protein